MTTPNTICFMKELPFPLTVSTENANLVRKRSKKARERKQESKTARKKARKKARKQARKKSRSHSHAGAVP